MKLIKITIFSFLFIGLTAFTTKTSEKETAQPLKKQQTIKVALLLDTSNSMDGLINQAKAQLWEIVNELSYAKCGNSKPNLQIALYEYGNDGLSSRNGYIRRVLRFSSDLDEISERLFSLTTNGGSEFCGTVIQTSLDELEWGKNEDDLKMIFIAGNEPFTQGKINYVDAVVNAKEKDVVVNTIFCGDYNNGISGMWQDGARRGDGDYMTINHNKKVVHIVTPYDDEIIILNKKLNKTYIYYGDVGYSKYQSQAKEDLNAESLDEVVVVKRAVTKSSRLYNNSSWDLVDAEKDKDFKYSKLKKKQLPKELRNKSTEEIKKYVTEKSNERKEIQQKIQELNKKRRDYVANKQRENSTKDQLESVMIQAIKKQAKKKNYTW
ncbi:vWA domain-containing protein [Tenacibaculum sp. IB213877]|uniref:vWA domain-containing protein n=1 Tax=Tenacibaculum sp. IB213877 TaxID=3097351 RepID=UPI002A5A0C99|nr:vWA domain-containing protein [Tenacibaculum sp. IB213877]MDY0780224.1 VWA domain-containing protein [Tenacibaculum sp. IB213877]